MLDETLNQQAAATAPASEDTATPDAVETGAPEEAEPKTFTQEELDRIIAAEKAKVERKLRRELAQQTEQPQRTTVSETPKRDAFKSDEEYLEALVDFRADQKLADREQQKRQRTIDSTFEEREETIREKYSDYDRLVRLNDDLKITPLMGEAIKESEIGPEIAYHLGKNPKEAERIASLSPLAQAREIGKIEAKLVENPPVKKVTSAPDPIKTVGSRSTTPNYDPTDPRSTKALSDSDWIKARNKQVAQR